MQPETPPTLDIASLQELGAARNLERERASSAF